MNIHKGLTAWWNMGLYIVGVQYITSCAFLVCEYWILSFSCFVCVYYTQSCTMLVSAYWIHYTTLSVCTVFSVVICTGIVTAQCIHYSVTLIFMYDIQSCAVTVWDYYTRSWTVLSCTYSMWYNARTMLPAGSIVRALYHML